MANGVRITSTNNLTFQTTAEVLGTGQTPGDGQTVAVVAQHTGTGLYLDGNNFNSVAPVENAMSHVNGGNWEHTAVGAFDGSELAYRTRFVFNGPVQRDPGYAEVETVTNATNVISIPGGSVIDANIVQVGGQTSGDGGNSWYKILGESIIGILNGRVRKDFPTTGKLTTYKQDDTTVLTTVSIDDNGITRDV